MSSEKVEFFGDHTPKLDEHILATLLTANDGYTRFGNLIFLWFWTTRTTPRSSATHAPGSGLISTDALSPQIANFIKKSMAVKGLSRVGNLKLTS